MQRTATHRPTNFELLKEWGHRNRYDEHPSNSKVSFKYKVSTSVIEDESMSKTAKLCARCFVMRVLLEKH